MEEFLVHNLKGLDFKHDIDHFLHLVHGPLLGILHVDSG